MYFSLNNTGDKVKPGTRISLPPIAPLQNTQFDLIKRDVVKYFVTVPKERSWHLFTRLQKLGLEENLYLEAKPNNFLHKLMVNLAL